MKNYIKDFSRFQRINEQEDNSLSLENIKVAIEKFVSDNRDQINKSISIKIDNDELNFFFDINPTKPEPYSNELWEVVELNLEGECKIEDGKIKTYIHFNGGWLVAQEESLEDGVATPEYYFPSIQIEPSPDGYNYFKDANSIIEVLSIVLEHSHKDFIGMEPHEFEMTSEDDMKVALMGDDD